MFASIKIAIVVVVLATGGVGYMYVQKLQSDLETARANVAKMEVAVQTAEASIATLRADQAQMQQLNQTLQADLQKAEAYGDDLRGKLQRHNLTNLALKEPGKLEGKMNGATAKLWRKFMDDSGNSNEYPIPEWLQQSPTRDQDTNSNQVGTDSDSTSSETQTTTTN